MAGLQQNVDATTEMKISPDAIIPDAKITKYLLVPKQQNDKSKYLSQAEFTEENPEALKKALYQLIQAKEAKEDNTNEYGTFYKVEGELIGVNQSNLPVITIWLKCKIDSQFRFITLKPKKGKK